MRHRTQSSTRRALTLRLEVLEPRSLLSVTVGSSFQGLVFGQDGSDYEPPDTNVAVGPNDVVEMVNTALAVYNKGTGALLYDAPLSAIFPQDSGLSFSDPQITYDNLKDQFFIGAIAYTTSGSPQVSHFDYALLNGDSPSTTPVGGSVHYLDMSENGVDFADFPRIGWNADAYFVTTNQYQGNSFSHIREVTIDKGTSVRPFGAVDNSKDSSGDFTLVPATMHDATTGGPEYFVEEHGFDNGSQLQVIEMASVTSSSPGYTSGYVTVPSYGAPPKAAQPGGQIATNDTRILDVVESGGRLIATQTVGNGSAANARVYDMTVAQTAPTIAVALNQTLQINPGNGVSTYYPAADIDSSGDLGITYMQSSSKQYMSMYVTGQAAGMPSGYVLQPVQVKAGQGTYKGSRAGDYSGVGFDYSGTGEFWAGSEYAQTSSNYWGTWIAGFKVAYASGDGVLNATPGSSGSSGGGSHHRHTGQPIPNLDDPLVILLAASEGSKKKS